MLLAREFIFHKVVSSGRFNGLDSPFVTKYIFTLCLHQQIKRNAIPLELRIWRKKYQNYVRIKLQQKSMDGTMICLSQRLALGPPKWRNVQSEAILPQTWKNKFSSTRCTKVGTQSASYFVAQTPILPIQLSTQVLAMSTPSRPFLKYLFQEVVEPLQFWSRSCGRS